MITLTTMPPGWTSVTYHLLSEDPQALSSSHTARDSNQQVGVRIQSLLSGSGALWATVLLLSKAASSGLGNTPHSCLALPLLCSTPCKDGGWARWPWALLGVLLWSPL